MPGCRRLTWTVGSAACRGPSTVCTESRRRPACPGCRRRDAAGGRSLSWSRCAVLAATPRSRATETCRRPAPRPSPRRSCSPGATPPTVSGQSQHAHRAGSQSPGGRRRYQPISAVHRADCRQLAMTDTDCRQSVTLCLFCLSAKQNKLSAG